MNFHLVILVTSRIGPYGGGFGGDHEPHGASV